MAVEPKSLGVSVTSWGKKVKFSGNSSPAKLKAVVGDPFLPVLTPLTFDTTTQDYSVWVDAGQLDAFLVSGSDGENGHQSSSTGETMIVVSLGQFEVAYEDIPVPAGQTQSALLTAVQGLNARRTGIHVRKVPGGSV